MTKSLFLAVVGAVALIATTLAFSVSNAVALAILCIVAGVLIGARGASGPCALPTRDAARELTVAIGVVRAISEYSGTGGAGDALVTIDVQGPAYERGQSFTGRLCRHSGDPMLSELRPGVVVLVAFDPVAREQLSLADGVLAVHAAFDATLIRTGLASAGHLDLVRRGVKSFGVVTAMRATGTVRTDYREVELDLMVSRPEGGQFPAHQRTLIPAAAVVGVRPGSIVEAYYRRGEEGAIAVCVPPS